MTDSITVNETTIGASSDTSNMTAVEKEKYLKNKETENIEEILQTGQENRAKGIKATIEINSAIEEQKIKKRNDVLNKLDFKKEFDTSYKNSLAQSLADILALIEWLPGWSADVIVTNGSPITIRKKPFTTQPGILLVVYTNDGGVFHRGITVTKEPVLDYAAVYNMAMQAENTMDETRKRLEDLNTNPDIVDTHGKPIRAKSIAGS